MGGVNSCCLRHRQRNRQRHRASSQSAANQKTRPKHEFLSEKELGVVRETWLRLKDGDAHAMGIRIFLRIFELTPDTKLAFAAFRNLTMDELRGNIMFRCHAMRFMRAVEVTMNHLDALDLIIVPNLKQLGRKHVEFHGFRPEYLRTFEIAMDEVWSQELGRKYNARARKAWNKIFCLITSKVLEGYTEEDDDFQKRLHVAESVQGVANLAISNSSSSSAGQLMCSDDASAGSSQDQPMLFEGS